MENARRFLARAVPWPTAQDNWWISIHSSYLRRDGKRSIGFGWAFKDLDAAAWWIENVLRDETDVYVCMAGIAVAEERRSKKKGRLYHVANRIEQNAIVYRSIWLEADVVTELKKLGFASSEAAHKAVIEFCRKANLPEPTFIVWSGSGGLHAHWVFEDPISRADWSPLAHALVLATQHFELTPLDLGPITNPVQVLRVPDTRNWKTDPPKPVWLQPTEGKLVSLERMQAALAPFMHRANGHAPQPILPGQSILGPNFPVRPPLPFDRRKSYPEMGFQGTIDDVAVNCPFIAETLKTGGKGLNEPVWFESLQVGFHTRDPHGAAHRLSQGHDGYDFNETEDKLGRIEKDRRFHDRGWPLCSTIAATGAPGCPTCPHRDKGLSPFHFVTPPRAADAPPNAADAPPNGQGHEQAPLPDPDYGWLPSPYYHDKEGLVWRPGEATDENPNPKAIKVSPLPITQVVPIRRREDNVGEYALQFETALDRTNRPLIYLPYKVLNDTRALFTHLAGDGFHVSKFHKKQIEDLMAAFVENLRASKLDATPSETLGWSISEVDAQGLPTGFVHGRTRYNCAGNKSVTTSRDIDDIYIARGSLDRWKEAARLITDQKSPALDALVACAFAAPLVGATGHAGMVINVHGESGSSKSTGCRVGRAVWANPAALPVASSTANYLDSVISSSGSLPIYVDDWQNQSKKDELVRLVFGMSQGGGKGRLGRDAQRKPINHFKTLLIMTSNYSLVEFVMDNTKMTEAGAYRMFEFRVPVNKDGTGVINIADGAVIDRALDVNYGCAGQIFAEFLGKNIPKVWKEVRSFNHALVSKLKAKPNERFWIAAITVIYMGAHYANQLGLTNINLDVLIEFLLQQLDMMRRELRKGSQDFSQSNVITDVVANYIAERRQQTLITGKLWNQPGSPPVGWDANMITSIDRIFGRVCIRAVKEDKLLRISRNDFASWAKQRDYQPKALVKAMVDQQLAKELRGTLAAHTRARITGGTAQEPLLEFNLQHLPFLFSFD